MKFALVGAGKMGGAILTGALRAEVLTPEGVGIYHPNPERRAALSEKFGVAGLDDDAIHHAEQILIAIKPQSFEQVAPLIATRNAVFISIMAGFSAEGLARRLGSRRVLRAMPNLGSRIGLSATAITSLPEASGADLAMASRLFAAIGTVYQIPETLFNAFTGLAGSGPAFTAAVAEAMADGGVRVGFSREMAKDLVRQVLLATAHLLENDGPSRIKDMVSSPGGTAIAGIKALEQHRLRYALIDAIEQATNRAEQLSEIEE